MFSILKRFIPLSLYFFIFWFFFSFDNNPNEFELIFSCFEWKGKVKRRVSICVSVFEAVYSLGNRRKDNNTLFSVNDVIDTSQQGVNNKITYNNLIFFVVVSFKE